MGVASGLRAMAKEEKQKKFEWVRRQEAGILEAREREKRLQQERGSERLRDPAAGVVMRICV
jgi:hypothetical protein